MEKLTMLLTFSVILILIIQAAIMTFNCWLKNLAKQKKIDIKLSEKKSKEKQKLQYEKDLFYSRFNTMVKSGKITRITIKQIFNYLDNKDVIDYDKKYNNDIHVIYSCMKYGNLNLYDYKILKDMLSYNSKTIAK